MNLTEDERQAFDLYFAHAYQAKVNEQAVARTGAQRLAVVRQVDLVDNAAETAMEMLAARRERLGEPAI